MTSSLSEYQEPSAAMRQRVSSRQDQETAVFTKCAFRIIPLLMLLFIVNYIDRVNVGFAALTMNRDLGFSPAVYGLGAGIFQLSYGLFHVPVAVLVARVGVKRSLFWICLLWGAISASNAFVQEAWSFYTVRLLLGAAESGFLPAVMYYLILWFPSAYRARCNSAFWSGVPMAVAIGGPLSVLILQMDGLAGFHGWQWLFVIEAVPAVLLAFAMLVFLPACPSDAAWLNSSEKQMIAGRLQTERSATQHKLWNALGDLRVIGLGVVYLGWAIGFYGLVLWLPQIVQSMGLSNVATGFIVAAPYLLGIGSAFLWSRSSDAYGERIWHSALALLLAAAGFAFAGAASSNLLVLAGLALATIGMCAATSPIFSVPSSYFSGTAVAGAIALVNAIARIGGFLGPIIVGLTREHTGTYSSSMLALGLALLLSAAMMLVVGRTLGPREILTPIRL